MKKVEIGGNVSHLVEWERGGLLRSVRDGWPLLLGMLALAAFWVGVALVAVEVFS